MKIRDSHIIKKGIQINESECLFFTKTDKIYHCKYEYEVHPEFVTNLSKSKKYYYAIYKKISYYHNICGDGQWKQNVQEVNKYKIKRIKERELTKYLHLII